MREGNQSAHRRRPIQMRKLLTLLIALLAASACSSSGNEAADTSATPTSIEPLSVEDDVSELAEQNPSQVLAQTVRESLAEARGLWSAAEILDYVISSTESQNYWAADCTWTTVVASGVPAETTSESVNESEFCGGDYSTVEDLYTTIGRYATHIDNAGPAEFEEHNLGENVLEISYNEVGVPQSIKFDLANGADEESTLSVSFCEVTEISPC